MAWTTLHLQVTTPLFNGGAEGGAGPTAAEPRPGDGIRVPSLRGAMRFWFRALAGFALGPELPALARMEAAVFGNTKRSSPVALRMPRPVTALRDPRPPWVDVPGGRWIVYLLGQGLGDLRALSGPPAGRGRVAGSEKRAAVRRPFVPAGTAFDLQVRFTEPEPAALAIGSLWLLTTYGGLGARTRRGFGGLRIVGVDGALPPPWDATSVLTPGLDHHERLTKLYPTEQLARSLLGLRHLAGDAYDAQREWTPTYPVLHRTHTRAATSGGDTFEDWADVLAYAGEQLRHFRAGQPNHGAAYRPPIKTPEWEQVVTGPGSHFGLGALGLPVVYKDKYLVNADRRVGPGHEQLRRASPLWLRPVGTDGAWRLLSHAFRCRFLPVPEDPGLGVHVWRDGRPGKPVTVDDADVIDRTDRWINTLTADGSFT